MTGAPRIDPSSAAGRRYRFARPTLATVLRDLRIPRSDPGPGDRIPRFDLPTTDGGRYGDAAIAARGRPVVLVLGSLTCPVTESAGAGLVDLHQTYGALTDFLVVNVREAHPGADVPQPHEPDAKLRNARALRDHHGFAFPVAVDDIDGTLHRALGTRPSSAYLVDASGTIVFRAHWSNSLGPLEEALRAVLAGARPPRATASQTVRALARTAGHAEVAFRSAGRGAWRDFWLTAPPVAAFLTASRAARSIRAVRGHRTAHRAPERGLR